MAEPKASFRPTVFSRALFRLSKLTAFVSNIKRIDQMLPIKAQFTMSTGVLIRAIEVKNLLDEPSFE